MTLPKRCPRTVGAGLPREHHPERDPHPEWVANRRQMEGAQKRALEMLAFCDEHLKNGTSPEEFAARLRAAEQEGPSS